MSDGYFLDPSFHDDEIARTLASGVAPVLFRYRTVWHQELTFGFTLPPDTRPVLDSIYRACGRSLASVDSAWNADSVRRSQAIAHSRVQEAQEKAQEKERRKQEEERYGDLRHWWDSVARANH